MATKLSSDKKYTVERNDQSKQEARWLIFDHSILIGFVTKFKNTRTETHPYKAFKRIGDQHCQMISVFYADEHGGAAKAKAKAIQAVKG